MSAPYHPETDGQTERANRMIEQTLRAYVNAKLDNWCRFLPNVEFALNNAVQSSTGFTPFYLNSLRNHVAGCAALWTGILVARTVAFG